MFGNILSDARSISGDPGLAKKPSRHTYSTLENLVFGKESLANHFSNCFLSMQRYLFSIWGIISLNTCLYFCGVAKIKVGTGAFKKFVEMHEKLICRFLTFLNPQITYLLIQNFP